MTSGRDPGVSPPLALAFLDGGFDELTARSALRSLVVILVFGALAYATLRGVLAPLRISVLESLTVALPWGARADLPGRSTMWFSIAGPRTRPVPPIEESPMRLIPPV